MSHHRVVRGAVFYAFGGHVQRRLQSDHDNKGVCMCWRTAVAGGGVVSTAGWVFFKNNNRQAGCGAKSG
jgi:hypothetical protein